MKETKEDLNKCRDYCAHRFRLDIVISYLILSPNLSEDSTYNLNQSNSMIFWRNRQADTKVYVEKPKQF